MTDSNAHDVLPPLRSRGGLGRGQLLSFLAIRGNPLPTSPCAQGEEQSGGAKP